MSTTLGFFGKLPSHGDFVVRGLTPGFVEIWDDWLQHGIAASKAVLGDEWLNVYLTSPIWRFVLNPNICGARGWTGVLVPSVDRVGRYFPLTIACAVPEDTVPLQVVTGAGAWMAEVEAIALRALSDDTLDADTLALEVAEVGGLDLGAGRVSVVETPPATLPTSGMFIPFAEDSSPGQGTLVLAHRLIQASCGGSYTLWWTGGSDRVRPGMIACTGLPESQTYTGLLDERFLPPSWQRLGGYRFTPDRPVAAPVVTPATSVPVPTSSGVHLPPDEAVTEATPPPDPIPAPVPVLEPLAGSVSEHAEPIPAPVPVAIDLTSLDQPGSANPPAVPQQPAPQAPGPSTSAPQTAIPQPVEHGDIEPIEVTAARIADQVAAAARAAETAAAAADDDASDPEDTLVPGADGSDGGRAAVTSATDESRPSPVNAQNDDDTQIPEADTQIPDADTLVPDPDTAPTDTTRPGALQPPHNDEHERTSGSTANDDLHAPATDDEPAPGAGQSADELDADRETDDERAANRREQRP